MLEGHKGLIFFVLYFKLEQGLNHKIKANEQVGLTTMHTVFLRLHNNMGGELYDLNRSLTGDEIYYTVRKIIGAIMQKITYNDWLPTILGMIIFITF